MKYLQLILSAAVIIIFSACEEDSPKVENYTLEVELPVNGNYSYHTNISGDEEGALIYRQAKKFKTSEILRDSSTNFEAIYRYEPATNFAGFDTVQLQLLRGSDGASSSNDMEFVNIAFHISE